jgi:small-conductance mechanosensitive channel
MAALPLAQSYGTFVPPTGMILVVLLMLGAGAAVWFGAWAVFRAIAAIAKRTPGETDDRLIKRMAHPLASLLAVVAAAAVLFLVAGRADPAAVPLVRNLVYVALVLSGSWVLVRSIRLVLEAAGKRRERLLPATRVTSRIISVVVFTTAFLMILQQFGIAITPVIAGLGIAGLAAALALQDTLGNFFAGLSIQTGQALQPGHYVKLENEKLDGYVETVGWRTTSIRTLGGNTIVIPNSVLAEDVVTDYYLPSKDMSVVMTFRTGLEADPKKVIDILVEEAKAAYKAEPQRFDAGKEPFAQFSGLDEYSMTFSLILRIPEYVQQWGAQHAVWLRVIERFRKEGIRIPYPTRHNYTEPVKPEARRVPGAPGGLAPRGRPKPKRREVPESMDPREAEASKARREIAAKQERKIEDRETP